MDTLRDALLKVDGGRFKKLIDSLEGLSDTCLKCDYFNPNINDKWKAYRCHVAGSCPDATMNTHLKSYMLREMGLISDGQHMANIGIDLKEE